MNLAIRILIYSILLMATCKRLSAQYAIQYPGEPLVQRLERISKDFNIIIAYDLLQLKGIAAQKTELQTANIEPALKLSLEKTGFRYQKQGAIHYYIVPVPKGNITGVVIDAEEGTPLEAVSIETGKGVFVSSSKGAFNISLEEGVYDIVLSAIGYETKQIPSIKVQRGSALYLTLALQKRPVSLNPVKVVSSVATENIRAHYIRQKQAGVVTDGLSAPQVETIPDKPLSQIIKRINGVSLIGNTVGIRGLSERYSQVLVDGIALPSCGLNKRGLALDIFPKELVREMILTKTAAADAPAEFSGGQIHIHSLSIPDRSFTSFALETGGNSQSAFKNFQWLGNKGKLDWLGIDDGTRKKPANIKSWQWYNDVPLPPPNDPSGVRTLIPGETAPYHSLNAIEQSKTIPAEGLVPSQGMALPDFNLNFSLGRSYVVKDSVTLGFVAGTSVYRRRALAHLNNRRRAPADFQTDPAKSGTTGEGTSFQLLSGTGTLFNIGLKTSTFNITFKNIFSTQLKDNFSTAIRSYQNKGQTRHFKELFQEPEQYFLQQHKLEVQKTFANGMGIDYFLSFTNTVQKLSDRRYLQYFLTSGTGAAAVYNTPNILYNWKQNSDSNVVDNRTWMDGAEKNYTSGLSFSKRVLFSKSFGGNIKAGWTGTLRYKTLSALRLLPYTNANAALTGQYDQLLDPAAGSPVFYWAENTNGNIYSGKMNNQAFYLLADQTFRKRFRLFYGIRAMYYDMQSDQRTFLRRRYNGTIPPQYHNGITGEKNWYWQPSGNMVYSVSKKMNIRAAFAKTVLQPDFRELSYFGLYEYELDGNIGGRQLRTTKVDNYDLRWEWYPSLRENISLSFFHKRLKDPVELVQAGAFPTAYGYINQHAAQTSGIELEVRKSLQFLSPQSFLKYLTVHANYTVNWSKVEVMSFPTLANGEFTQSRMPNQDRPLFNQAPWAANAGLLYNGKKTGLSIFYNKSGPKTYITHINPNLVEYENGADQLDLSFYVKCIKDKGRITFNALNLLNPWRIYYTNSKAYTSGNTGSWQLTNGSVGYNAKDGDTVTFKIRQGINANIGITLAL